MRIGQRLLLLSIIIFSLLVLLACSGNNEPTPVAVATPRVITLSSADSPLPTPGIAVSILPTPIPFQFPTDPGSVKIEAGKAVLFGRLISTITGQSIANTPVRMAQIYYAEEGNKDPSQGAWALDNAFSPYALTNENGYFIFENVEPVDFVIFVGDILNRYNVETGENERPVPHIAPADGLTNLGDILVEY